MLNLNTEHVTIFKCDDWLSKTKGNTMKLIRELGAEVDGKKLVQGKDMSVVGRSHLTWVKC